MYIHTWYVHHIIHAYTYLLACIVQSLRSNMLIIIFGMYINSDKNESYELMVVVLQRQANGIDNYPIQLYSRSHFSYILLCQLIIIHGISLSPACKVMKWNYCNIVCAQLSAIIGITPNTLEHLCLYSLLPSTIGILSTSHYWMVWKI